METIFAGGGLILIFNTNFPSILETEKLYFVLEMLI